MNDEMCICMNVMCSQAGRCLKNMNRGWPQDTWKQSPTLPGSSFDIDWFIDRLASEVIKRIKEEWPK